MSGCMVNGFNLGNIISNLLLKSNPLCLRVCIIFPDPENHLRNDVFIKRCHNKEWRYHLMKGRKMEKLRLHHLIERQTIHNLAFYYLIEPRKEQKSLVNHLMKRSNFSGWSFNHLMKARIFKKRRFHHLITPQNTLHKVGTNLSLFSKQIRLTMKIQRLLFIFTHQLYKTQLRRSNFLVHS